MEKRIEELKPFPEVRVVDKLLDPKWAAQYRERARPPRIEFGTTLLTMSDGEKMVGIYHEIGHWLRCEHLPRPSNGKTGEEAFADAFAQYMLQGKKLQRTDPETYEKFQRLLCPADRRKVQVFARMLLRKMT